MKTKFTIGNLEINGVKIENISIEQEYSVGEAVDMMKCGKDFVREIIRELPEVMEDVQRIMTKAEELDAKEDLDASMKRHLENLGIKGEFIRLTPGEFVRLTPEELFEKIHRPRG